MRAVMRLSRAAALTAAFGVLHASPAAALQLKEDRRPWNIDGGVPAVSTIINERENRLDFFCSAEDPQQVWAYYNLELRSFANGSAIPARWSGQIKQAAIATDAQGAPSFELKVTNVDPTSRWVSLESPASGPGRLRGQQDKALLAAIRKARTVVVTISSDHGSQRFNFTSNGSAEALATTPCNETD